MIDDAGKQRLTLSFYAYAQIQNPTQFRNELFLAWNPLEVLGRIYVAKEGDDLTIGALVATIDTSVISEAVPAPCRQCVGPATTTEPDTRTVCCSLWFFSRHTAALGAWRPLAQRRIAGIAQRD